MILVPGVDGLGAITYIGEEGLYQNVGGLAVREDAGWPGVS